MCHERSKSAWEPWGGWDKPGAGMVCCSIVRELWSVAIPITGGNVMTETIDTSAVLFAGKDEIVQAIYTRLLKALRTIGPVQEDPFYLARSLTQDSPVASWF